jgi:hypothetical protein
MFPEGESKTLFVLPVVLTAAHDVPGVVGVVFKSKVCHPAPGLIALSKYSLNGSFTSSWLMMDVFEAWQPSDVIVVSCTL